MMSVGRAGPADYGEPEGGDNMDKLKSRKFWMALLAAILPLISENFGLKLPVESILAIAAYILGQSYVDAKQQ